MHLAQLNIARLKYPIDDPRVADFTANLERVNATAERSEGFVWRLKDESGDATRIRAFDDPAIIVNMSVWRDAKALEHFVWRTVHRAFYQRRAEWFSLLEAQHFVMWWIDEAAAPPGLDEAEQRLAHLRAHGESDFAFGWAHLPHVNLWQQARCA
jgi:Domain of unknown function (DUF3291)